MEPDDGLTEERIEYLIEAGALTPAGYDEDGDILYVWNPEVLKEVDPEVFESLQEDARKENDAMLLKFLELGIFDVAWNEELQDFDILVTEAGIKWAESNGIEIIE